MPEYTIGIPRYLIFHIAVSIIIYVWYSINSMSWHFTLKLCISQHIKNNNVILLSHAQSLSTSSHQACQNWTPCLNPLHLFTLTQCCLCLVIINALVFALTLHAHEITHTPSAPQYQAIVLTLTLVVYTTSLASCSPYNPHSTFGQSCHWST